MIIRSISLKMLSQAASAGANILLIWFMLPEVFGMFVTLSSILLVTLTATANGVSTVVMRECLDNPTGTLNIQSICQKVVYLSLISICVTFVFFHSFYEVQIDLKLMIVIAIFCVSEVLLYYFVGILRGRNKLTDAILLETGPIIIFTITLICMLLYEPSVILAFFLKFVTNILFLTYGIFKIRQIFDKKFRFSGYGSKEKANSLLSAMKLGFSMSINRCLSVTDVLLISSLLGFSAVAQYKLSLIPVAVITIPSFLNVSMLYGSLKHALNTNTIGSLKYNLKKIYIINLMLVIACLAGLLIYLVLISKFEISSKLHIDVSITLIGVIGYFIWNCFGPTNATLILLNADNFLLKLNITLVVLNVIGSYFSIFMIGIDGPVLSTMIMMILGQIGKVSYARTYPNYIRTTAYDVLLSHRIYGKS